MKKFLLALSVIFILCGFSFSNEKSVNSISFSFISNYNTINGSEKSSISNLAASGGIESGYMVNIGIKLTSAGITNIIDGALWLALGFVFVWLMWEDMYPLTPFNSGLAWSISFTGPYITYSGSIYAGLANFSLVFSIISFGIGVLLLIPGIILWAVGASSGSAKLKKEQKIVPVVTGDKIGVIIKL